MSTTCIGSLRPCFNCMCECACACLHVCNLCEHGIPFVVISYSCLPIWRMEIIVTQPLLFYFEFRFLEMYILFEYFVNEDCFTGWKFNQQAPEWWLINQDVTCWEFIYQLSIPKYLEILWAHSVQSHCAKAWPSCKHQFVAKFFP